MTGAESGGVVVGSGAAGVTGAESGGVVVGSGAAGATGTRPSSPIAARVEVVRPAAADDRGKVRAATAVTVGEDEAVFPGHYPGFPIFPGVCVIECVHLSGLRTPPPGAAGLELVAVESTRFLSPVFPGDRLEVDLVWTGGSGTWRCAAKVATERGAAAQVRLRFTAEEA
ncbi:3-hydroxyacyl-ACP dehydratase FabZ family protein [Streptomyces rhizosphaericus]|uniref:3-hydroxyacyl-ACP dehydratase FabZ family protein n=1 Tax=Streptomyces rhizosphaericus TaxID=114699 RepID=UPI003631335A